MAQAADTNGNRYNSQYVFAFYFDNRGKILGFREHWEPLYAYETMYGGKIEF